MIKMFAAATMMAIACTTAQAQWWNPMDPIGPGKRGTIAEPEVVYTSAVYQQAQMAASGYFFSDKFVELERMYDEFMEQKLRATDGRYMVQAIQDAIAGSMGTMEERLADNVFKSWETKVPDSKLRPILLAVRHQAQAWKARGTRYATTEEGVQIFRERLQLASKALADSEQAGKDSPIWWWVALIVAGSSGASPAQMDAIFEEAASRFPSYQTLYYTRMNYLQPRWGGSEQAMNRFAAASVARTASVEGQGMYAWLYLDLAAKRCCEDEVLEYTWPKLKASFDDLVARHPDTRNKNYYASYACRARDKETTARLLQELGEKASSNAIPGVPTEGCRRFAFAGTSPQQ